MWKAEKSAKKMFFCNEWRMNGESVESFIIPLTRKKNEKSQFAQMQMKSYQTKPEEKSWKLQKVKQIIEDPAAQQRTKWIQTI